jgi:hypothetical protein
MRKVALSLFVLWTLTLADSQSKSAKVKQLQDQCNAEYPACAKECIGPVTAGSSELLKGEKLTPDRTAALETKKKEREAQCKPGAERLHRFRKKLLLHSSSAVLL